MALSRDMWPGRSLSRWDLSLAGWGESVGVKLQLTARRPAEHAGRGGLTWSVSLALASLELPGGRVALPLTSSLLSLPVLTLPICWILILDTVTIL